MNKDVSRLLDRIVEKLSRQTGFQIGKADVLRNLIVAEAKRLKIKSTLLSALKKTTGRQS